MKMKEEVTAFVELGKIEVLKDIGLEKDEFEELC